MKGTASERFWAKVNKTSDCWLWIGKHTSRGYGMFNVAPKHLVRAHRQAWVMANGPIPEGCVVRHVCDVRGCVRPDHLELGNQTQNIADMDLRGRRCRSTSKPRDHCRRGHPMIDGNLYVYSNGTRTCRTCALARA